MPGQRIRRRTEGACGERESARIRGDEGFERGAAQQRAVIELDATSRRETHPADVRGARGDDAGEQRRGAIEAPGVRREALGRCTEP